MKDEKPARDVTKKRGLLTAFAESIAPATAQPCSGEHSEAKQKKLFITATGTNIGKTLVSCALLHQWREQGLQTQALKPLMSGVHDAELAGTDAGQLLQAQGREVTRDAVASVSPWRFAAPLSPDMAARLEGRKLDGGAILECCSQPYAADRLLVEGVGGVMVPMNDRFTTLDWMQALGWPVVLVTGSYVGTISHTLTALEALASRYLIPSLLVISESAESAASLAETEATLQRFIPAEVPVATIPRLAPSAKLWQHVPDLTHYLELHEQASPRQAG